VKKHLVMLLILTSMRIGYAAPIVHAPRPVDSVYICMSGSAHKYHKYICRGLDHCTHTIKKVPKSEAVRLGYTACKIC